MNVLITCEALDIPSYETFRLFCNQMLKAVESKGIRLILLNQPKPLAVFIEAYAQEHGYPCDLMSVDIMLQSADAAIIFKSPTTVNPLIELLDEYDIKKRIKLINTNTSTP